jgi:Uncharacterized protein conserved in bacteria
MTSAAARGARHKMILVLGMHRGGTSAAAGMLAAAGVDFGRHLMPATPDNPRGYFEDLDLVEIHDRLLADLARRWDDPRPLPPDWPQSAAAGAARSRLHEWLLANRLTAGIKDPRQCRLLRLWFPLLDEFGIASRSLIVVRDASEVAASFASRDGLSLAAGALLWLRHLLDCERDSRGQSRGWLSFADLLQDPVTALEHHAPLLQLSDWRRPERIAAVRGFVDRDLRRQNREVNLPEPIATWVKRFTFALQPVLRGSADGDLSATCDALTQEMAPLDHYITATLDPLIDDLQRGHIARLRQIDREHASIGWRIGRTLRLIPRVRVPASRGGR